MTLKRRLRTVLTNGAKDSQDRSAQRTKSMGFGSGHRQRLIEPHTTASDALIVGRLLLVAFRHFRFNCESGLIGFGLQDFRQESFQTIQRFFQTSNRFAPEIRLFQVSS